MMSIKKGIEIFEGKDEANTLSGYGRSSVGRAVVSKTKGREFESYRPCK